MPATLRLLRQSKRFEYRLVGISATPAPLAEELLDAFYVIPRGDDPEYGQAMLQVIRRERPDVALPWSDDEAEVMSRLSGDMQALGAIAMVSSPECLARISNKRITYEHLRSAGVAVPEFTPVFGVSELRKAVAAYGYPQRTVVVKPSRGRGGRGLQVLLGRDAPPDWLGSGQRETRLGGENVNNKFADFFKHGEELLVMPCLGVPAFDADVVIFGQTPAVLVRRRHNPTGIPFVGNTVVADPQLLDYCGTVARVLKLEAIHDIDLMAGVDGRPVILEVNPRPSGSLAAGMAAGFPVLDWAVERALGGNPPTIEPERDIDVLSMVVPQVVGCG